MSPLPPGYEWNQDWSNYGSMNKNKPPSYEQIKDDKAISQEGENLFKEWDWQNQDSLGPQGEDLPTNAVGWKPNGEADYGAGLKGWWTKVTSRVGDAYQGGYEEGVRISGLQQTIIKKQHGEEAGQKRIDELKDERKPQDENTARWTAAAEGTKEVFNQALWGVLDGFSQISMGVEQVLGTAGYTLADALDPNRDVNAETFQENLNASRMSYSGIFDASIFEEMNRRIDSGIRPDLAQQEVMILKPWTMWPELIGQMVLDPLNTVTVWTKAGAAIKIEKSVAKTFHAVVNPELAKILDNADELAKMDDSKAFQYLNELATSQQGLTAATEHADAILDASGKLDELSKTYRVASLTSSGKLAHVANQTGEILMHIVNNSGPDEALEVLRGMVKSVSTNGDEAAEGVSAMMHFPDARALFSEAGNNTTVVMAKMMAKHGDTWLDDIAALKDNPAELSKMLMTKLDEVTGEMFPSVTKMLEAEKLVKAGGEVTEATRKLAERAGQIPESVKALTRFHDAAQKVVGPINKAFIGAYMGWSPGYAFRNFTNNSTQLLIDYGPGILLGKADDLLTKAEKLHGGLLQGAFSEGGQMASLFPDVVKVGAHTKETGIKAILKSAVSGGLNPLKGQGPSLGMGQVAEANAAKRIIAKTYTKTFNQGVKAMTKAMQPELKAAGFSDDLIKKLPTYIMQNDGDAAKVIEALRKDVSEGVIDLFNDIDRIDPKHKSFMSDLGKWDEYAETVLKAETPEAANAAAKKIFDDIAEAGNYAYRDARPVVSDHDKFLKMAEEKGGLPGTRAQVISIRQSQNEKVIQAAESILAEADDLAAKLGLPVGTLKKARNINQIDGWGKEAAKEAHRLRDLAWELTNRTKKGTVNLSQLWTGFPELFKGVPPGTLDVKTLRDALWHGYDEVVSRTWGGARDTAVDNVKAYLADLKGAGAQIPDDWTQMLDETLDGAKQYDTAMIGRNGELIEETAMAFGTRTTQISAMATKYGIGTATEAGKPLDKNTLQLINKYADVNYKSLEDVPVSVAEEAFKAKAGKVTEVAELAEGGATIEKGAQLSDGVAESADEMNQIRRASGTQVPSAYEAGTYELSKGITRSERMKEVASYAEKYKGEYDRIGVRVQDKVYKAKVGEPLNRKSYHWKDGNKTRKKLDGISSVDIKKAKQLRNVGYDGNVILVLGSNYGNAGEDLAEVVLREPVVLDIIDDSSFFDKAAETGVAEEAFAKKAGSLPSGSDAVSEVADAAKVADPLATKAGAEVIADADGGATIKFADGGVNKLTAEQVAKQGGIEAVQKMTVAAQDNVARSIESAATRDAELKAAVRNPDLPYYDDAGNLVEPTRSAKRILPPAVDGEAPTASRAVFEQMDEVGRLRAWVMDDIAKNFGKKQLVDKASESALKLAEREITKKLAETRLISSRVAQANRDFTLLNYGNKSYFDMALAYLYPFHYWYRGTYTNWMKRIASNPAILGHYARYKETLGTVHAGMPEWWKYNINTNDLPGVDVENPLYFNLEATLWPLNGITGMDFNDPSKRVNWWTYGLDFANKFGPSTWTPLNMVTGLALLNKGEQEAGASWLGRLIPQTATIKAGASLLGIANLETDPFIKFLNPKTNMDKYEDRRAQRALANMMQDAQAGNSQYTPEQIQDAAYFQEGEIWDAAVRQSVRGRAPSQISSFLFGVGFKGRTEQDMQIDQFYTDYSKLWTMKANLTGDEFGEGMQELKNKYPFMDTVLLSRRDGAERDAGLAFLVMQRIPPGKSSEISDAAGIDKALLEKFYAAKGDISKWSVGDRTRFMSGVMTLNATLEIPTDMTRGEWADAKSAYGKVSENAKKMFGSGILDVADGYYQAKTQGTQQAQAYLDKYPQLQKYMDWKAERIMGSPMLSAYYGGASVIEGYYRNQQYADIEKQLGKDIFDVMNDYNDLKTWDPTEAKKLYNANKGRIKQYYQIKDAWAVRINQQVAQLSSSIPEGANANVREDMDVTSPIQQDVAGAVQPEEQMSYEDFQAVIPSRLMSLTEDYFSQGERLPEAAEKQLARIAQEMGFFNTDDLLQAIGTSMYQGQP